jgi:hypothetical protein
MTPNNGLPYNKIPNVDFAKTTSETLALCYYRILVLFLKRTAGEAPTGTSHFSK